ncbi:hypothetical protein BJ982_002876 [Sphaerisporangium siamense]|uniref:Uncharacterized protein n=1 Tax=Sphaerisporangium siamense TaxID=795645 RepID=A0A7W7G9G4_9ACTN|nr:hypothetical protein [Sphaerisporangium siamense]
MLPYRSSGEGRLAILQTGELLIPRLRRESVVLSLEPCELSLQIPDPLLETAHFRDHPRVETADVAE